MGLLLLSCTTTETGTLPEGRIEAGGQALCLETDEKVQCMFIDALGYDLGQLDVPENIHGISTRYATSCWLDADETLGCKGHNDNQQTEHPDGMFTQVLMEAFHACALDKPGAIHCWGASNTEPHWTQPPSGSFVRLGGSSYDTCAIDTVGKLACWGKPWNGLTEPPVGAFVEVEGANANNCAISTEGRIVCWGAPDYGVQYPPEGTGFHSIANAFFAACALNSANEAVCWGTNTSGQLSPKPGPFVQLSAGDYHICGRKFDGSISCWGCRSPEERACTWGEDLGAYYVHPEEGVYTP
jgi:hypothetical protein